MNQKERMLAGLPYKCWLDGLAEERLACKSLLYRLNNLPPEAEEEREALIYKVLGKCGEKVWLESPFRCDYGYNIEVGDNFYGNYNLTILDVGKVTAGSVVTRDLPPNSLAAGNPCRVLREITEADRGFYFKNLPFDVADY